MTLIEVMVVVALLAVLMTALSFGTLRAVRPPPRPVMGLSTTPVAEPPPAAPPVWAVPHAECLAAAPAPGCTAERTLHGRIGLLCRLAALGMLLFGGGFWYLNEGDRPGRLDPFRLGGLTLLGLNYALFYAVFAVLAVATPLGGAAGLVALTVSVPLLAFHVSRLTDRRFAVLRVAPLAVLSFGVVVGWTWLPALRALLVLGVAVGVIAGVTLTWPRWSAGRRAWQRIRAQQAVRDAREGEVAEALDAVADAVTARRAELQAAERVLRRSPNATGAPAAALRRAMDEVADAVAVAQTIGLGDPAQTDREHGAACAMCIATAGRARTRLERAGQGLERELGAFTKAAADGRHALGIALAAMDRAVEQAGLRGIAARMLAEDAPEHLASAVAGALEALRALGQSRQDLTADLGPDTDVRARATEARQLQRRAEQVEARLATASTQLAEALRHVDRAAPERAAVHCAGCGHPHGDGSRFCAGCGQPRPTPLTCGACGRTVDLPAAALRKDWRVAVAHCGGCGGAYARRARAG